MSARRARAVRPSGATAEDILRPVPSEVRAIVEAARATILGAIPGAAETPYPGWKALGYRDGQAGYFCGLFPRRDAVHLVFEHGRRLDDPEGLFEPGEHLKQVRYVVLRSPADANRAALVRLLRAAVRAGVV